MSAMHVIWWIGLVVTLVVFVPLSVYLLHCTWQASKSIEAYARDALAASAGIAAHTKHIPALDATIATAGEILNAAAGVKQKLAAVADVLEKGAR